MFVHKEKQNGVKDKIKVDEKIKKENLDENFTLDENKKIETDANETSVDN